MQYFRVPIYVMCRLKRSGVGKDSIPLKYGMWFIDKLRKGATRLLFLFRSGSCFKLSKKLAFRTIL